METVRRILRNEEIALVLAILLAVTLGYGKLAWGTITLFVFIHALRMNFSGEVEILGKTIRISTRTVAGIGFFFFVRVIVGAELDLPLIDGWKVWQGGKIEFFLWAKHLPNTMLWEATFDIVLAGLIWLWVREGFFGRLVAYATLGPLILFSLFLFTARHAYPEENWSLKQMFVGMEVPAPPLREIRCPDTFHGGHFDKRTLWGTGVKDVQITLHTNCWSGPIFVETDEIGYQCTGSRESLVWYEGEAAPRPMGPEPYTLNPAPSKTFQLWGRGIAICELRR